MSRLTLRKFILLLAVGAMSMPPLFSGEDDFLKPVGKPPKAKAQRRQGGEALPPLPLPATPLRRSEKKRPPSAGMLVGKVVWGGYIDHNWEDGLTARVFDWNMVPADGQQLLALLKRFTGMEYKVQTVDLATFSGEPSEVPVLLISGGRALRLSDADRSKLRKYLMDGGMIWFDSVVGSPYFYHSALKEMAAILPEAPITKIPPDHPVLRMVKPVGAVATNKGDLPYADLDGVYIGSRLAAVISPYGLGCGWDDIYPELVSQAKYYRRNAAVAIGANLAAYAIGWFEVGQAYAKTEAYSERDAANDPGRIVFAQVRFRGVWNTDPGAESGFMRFLSRSLKMDAGVKPVYVDLGVGGALDDYPFLYLSGLGDFSLAPNEEERLRRYLANGGCLLVNNSLGLNNFDTSFRRELAKVLPQAKLERIPPTHPIFSRGPYMFSGSGFSAAADGKYPGCSYPLLYGVKNGDRYSLVYSPVDLGGGWTGTFKPGSVAYEPEMAGKLGANLVTYFMTH